MNPEMYEMNETCFVNSTSVVYNFIYFLMMPFISIRFCMFVFNLIGFVMENWKIRILKGCHSLLTICQSML